MKKSTFLLFFIGTLLLVINNAGAQDIATDNKGEPIFTVPSSKRIIPEVALKNIGINFTPFHLNKVKYYVMDNGSKYYTMDKSTVINVKANLIDNDDDVFTIAKGTKLTPHVEIGFARSIDALINPRKINKYYTFSGSVFADFQSFDLYDTLTQKFLPKYRRTSFGARMGMNIFFKTKSAIALNMSYKNAIVTDEETPYQKRASNTIYTDNNILTNGTTDGYLSPLDPTENLRFSVAFPQFIKSSLPLAITPYYFVQLAEGSSPRNNAGLLFTILNDRFRDFDNNNGTDRNASKKYSFESAFSVGLNLISTGSSNRSFLFISGTISLGKSKETSNEKNKSKNLL